MERYINFGKNVKIARIRKGIDQRELARLSGYGLQSIGFIEQGRRVPSFEGLRRIANALDVSVGELLTDELSFSESDRVQA